MTTIIVCVKHVPDATADRHFEADNTVDRVGVDGAVEGGSAAVGGISGVLRRVQNGFVRSYALSLLGGALLVVLALLAVNLA